MRFAGLAVAALLATAACDEETTLSNAPDAADFDAGDGDPLPLTPGMEMTYEATMTRFTTDTAQIQAQYAITVRIVDVTDADGDGPSAVRFEMTDDGAGSNPGWTLAQDFDSWVGRLGPAIDADVVDPAPVELVLNGAPELPPAPVGGAKTLPVASTFFIDVRELAAIQAEWEATELAAGRVPSIPNPTNLFSEGPDDRLQFHDAKERRIDLAYDEDGILEGISERIGGTGFPRTTTELNRTSGP